MNSDSPLLVLWDKCCRLMVLALRSLWLHKLRASLSVLGIIIGTAAVISLMAFGEGSMHDALEDIKRQGATNIIVRSIKPPDDGSSQRRSFTVTYGLTYADFERFQMVSSVIGSVPMRIVDPQEIRRMQYMHRGRVVGTTAAYQNINKIQLVMGRFLVDADEEEGDGDDVGMRNVCVLGSDVAEAMFPFESPLGQTVVLNKHLFVVVGVLAERMPTGAVGGSSVSAEEFNNDVYIPLRTCRGRYGERIYIRQSGARSGEQVELHQVTLTVTDMDQVRTTGDAVRDLLERNHLKKDWGVTVPLDRLEAAERQKQRFTVLLVFIASISLFVGGIGIMNIMLATVTERTREIGIRRALGAKRRDITFQFLIEAIVQTSVGGLFGVLLGLGIVYGVPYAAEQFFNSHLPAKLHVLSIFLSLGVSICVGVLFGWYPAQRASRLDPIEALRHE
ncbi:MAG: ABC transporter permease [Gemmataceae bacterium]|nr:ABC transporter permease [Gemmataceae bacterium]